MSGRGWAVARLLFVAAVLVGAWWSWRTSGADALAVLRDIEVTNFVMAQVLVIVGLAVTGAVWQTSLSAFGVESTSLRAVMPFFVAQLGKYVPGMVWSFAAQGAAGARQGIAARTAAAAAVLFLGMHLASGLVVTGVLGWPARLDPALVMTCLAVGLVGVLPVVYQQIGQWLAGRACTWRVRHSVLGFVTMLCVWSCYTYALVLVVPGPSVELTLTLGVGFALAHAVGILVPIAPAGVGAREGVLALVLTPALGAGGAAAVALTARLLHSVADFTVAGLAWLLLRLADRRHEQVPEPPRH